MFPIFSRSFSFSGSKFQNPSSLIMRSSKKFISHDIFLHEKQSCPIYTPRGPNQKLYSRYLNDPDISVLICTGPAGTGKTLFACATAVQELMDRTIDKIILTRPIIPVDEYVEHLHGSPRCRKFPRP